jgi:PAS domain S-box-containing protein
MDDFGKTRDELLDEVRSLRAQLAEAAGGGPRAAVEGRYRSVVDNVVDGVITVDDQGTIESFNPAAERIFGYRAEAVLGRNVSVLMPEPFAGQHRAHMQRYLDTGEAHIIGIGREVEGRRQDGMTFPIELSVSQFRLAERVMFTGIVRDITERKLLQAQLLQAQKMESIGQLAGGIAHDFNNQLGIILFDVDLLLAGSDHHPELRDDLLKIRRVVLRGANLARQLLLFGRRQQMEPRPTDLNHHVQELRKMLGRLLGEHIVVRLHLADDLAATHADASNIDQVILNLALNSRDAMPDGGMLEFATANVVVGEEYHRLHRQARPGRYVRLEVGDTGCGMSAEVQLRIFEPFFTTKEEGKGTGLGLAVVYGIVQAHGGWIDVESHPGRGTRFFVYLPAIERPPSASHPAEPTADAGRRGHGEEVLLLEDDPELRERTGRALVESGYQVTTCGTVAEARQRLAQSALPVQLLLCDVRLPDGRGTELVFAVRGQRPTVPVVLLTGLVDDHPDWERVRREGLPVLHKPFAVADLLSHVERALRTD